MSSSTARLHACTPAWLHDFTTVHDCTTARLHDCTKPHTQPHDCTTARFHDRTNAWPYGCTTQCTAARLQYCDTTAQLPMASAHTKQPGRRSLSPLPRRTHCSDSATVGSSASLLCRKTLSHGLSVSRLCPDTHLGFPSFHPHRCKDSDMGELIRKTKCSDATTIYGLFALKMEYDFN